MFLFRDVVGSPVTDLTPLTAVSRIQISQPQQPNTDKLNHKPLDKPTVVRPAQRSSVHIPSELNSPPVLEPAQYLPPQQQQQLENPFPIMYPSSSDPYSQPTSLNHTPATPSRKTSAPPPPVSNELTLQQLRARAGNTAFSTANSSNNQPPPFEIPPSPEKKVEVIPMNADKPTGLDLDDFLPRKLSGLGFNYNTAADPPSKYSSYKDYGAGSEMSESEVTSSILKGHDAMMAVLTNRGRSMEIIQKLWQSKDAKAAVDQAVSLNDQAIMVDLLSVITFRPSIWNLDLCESLLPVIEGLLHSKYEM